MRKMTTAAAILAAVFVTSFATPANAAGVTFTWDGGGGDDNWSTAANWVGDVAPGTDDDLVFALGDVSNNDFAGYEVGSILVDGAGVTITGNAFTINSGITLDAPSAVFGTDITASANQVWSANVFSALTLNGDVTVQPGVELEISGLGITLANGALDGSGSILKTGTGSLIVAGGGNLDHIVLQAGELDSDSVSSGTDVIVNGGMLRGGAVAPNLGVQLIDGITLNAGSVHPGGPFSVQTMKSSGSFAGAPGGVLSIQLDGATSDQLAFTGVLDPDGTRLDIVIDTVPAVGTTFAIVTASSESLSLFSDSVGAPIADGGVFTSNGYRFSLDYATTDVVLTFLGVAPAPGSGGALAATGTDPIGAIIVVSIMMLLGAALLASAARRRRTGTSRVS